MLTSKDWFDKNLSSRTLFQDALADELLELLYFYLF